MEEGQRRSDLASSWRKVKESDEASAVMMSEDEANMIVHDHQPTRIGRGG